MTYNELHDSINRYFKLIKLPRVPSFALKLLLGEKSQLLLDDLNAEPKKLIENHKFKDQHTLSSI